MNAQALLPMDTDTLLALVAHLRETGSEISLADAAALAVRAWLADNALAAGSGFANPPSLNAPGVSARADNGLADKGRADYAPAPPPSPASAAASGYQWKELFLPDGTDVRMRCDGDVYHARVNGDSIVYQGHRVSPRQLTLAVAGNGRNAWRDLSLRLPGEKRFQRASLLRHQVRAATKPKPGDQTAPQSPSATIAAAAAAMSEALRAALQLVEHSNAQSLPKYERRLDTHRRAADVLTEHTAFD